MRTIFCYGLVVVFSGLGWGCTATSSAPSSEAGLLQERMTAQEFRTAGLDRLEPAELRALNNWLRSGSVEERPREPGTARTEDWEAARDNPVAGFGLTPEAPASAELDQIRVQINDDAFDGWDGDDRFRLKNGQVWEQCGGSEGRLVMEPVENPGAVIERSLMSGFRLSIDGYNRKTQVCRIE